MKIIETIKRHANIALALGVMLSMIAAQAIPVFASPSVSAEDAAAVSHLEELYKAYIEEYGDKTTREGLLRVYDSALEINSDSFAKEKAAGYEVKLNAAVLRPIDGSEDKDGEITRGHNGYVNINAEVTKNSKAVGTVSFAQKITAGVKTLTYTRSSAEEASSVWNIGSGKYLNYYNGSADKLIVPEGVEEINWNNRSTWYKGDKTKVKIIIFPSTMKKVLAETLQGFTNLIAVYIPDGCTDLGASAFSGCTSLRYVRLSENFTAIPKSCFANTPALTQMYIPAGIKSIADRAFNGSALRDIVICADNFVGDGYDTHKNFVIQLNENINEEIKADVEADLKDDRGFIADRHFYYLGKNPTVKSNWLWYSCDIASGADYLWYTLIYALKGNSFEEFIKTQISNSLEDEYTTLEAADATLLSEQYRGIRKISDEEALSHLEELYRAYIKKYGDKTSREGLLRIYDTAFAVNADSFADEKAVGYKVKLNATVLRPVDGSCDKDGVITVARDGYVNISAEVTKDEKTVGTVKFTEVLSAEMKTLTYTKSSAGEDSSVWNIGAGKYLNYYNGSADKLIIPEGVEEVNSKTLGEWYKGDKTKVKIIVYPSTMKKIMPWTMNGFTNLMAVYIPDGCTEIGERAFSGCTSLRYVRLSEKFTAIPKYCFAGTQALTMLYLPAAVKSVADRAFYGSTARDLIITADDFTGDGYDTHKKYVTSLNENINEQVKEDVREDLIADVGTNLSNRSFFYLGKNPTVKSSWLWYSCDMDNGPDYLWYTYIYALKGNSIEEFIKTQTSNSLEDEYTALDNETAELLKTQHDKYMLNGRYPKEINTEVVQALIKDYPFTNNGSAAEFSLYLEKKLADTGYKAAVSNWYKLRAVPGCEDTDGVMFEGYNGYVTADIRLTSAVDTKDISIYGVIKPEIYSYSFETVAKADTFYPETVDGTDGLRGDTGAEGEFFLLSSDGTVLLDYYGTAEKIIIPEGVEYLDQSWWLDTDLTKVRCIILPDSLKVLPDQFGVPFSSNIEVIIMGDNVVKAEGKHSFWKCYKLKNLRLSENLENLNEEALFETLLLTDLHLPNALKTIDKGSFHLSALRDIVIPAGVESIANEAFAWPLKTLKYLVEGVRTQGNAISQELCDELDPILQKKIATSPGVYIPRTITVLSKNAEYAERHDFWNSDLSWIQVKVNYLPGSSTEKLINSGYASDANKYSYSTLGLSENELKVNMMLYSERVPVYSDIKAEDIEKYFASALSDEFVSKVEVTELSVTDPSKDGAGSLTARVTAIMKSGERVGVDISRIIPLIENYKTDMNRGGWTGKEYKYDNKFVPSITRYEDETVTEYVDVPIEVPNESRGEEIKNTDGGDGEEETVTITKVIKKKKKKPAAAQTNIVLPIVLSVAGFVLVCGAVVLFCLIKRRKKHS